MERRVKYNEIEGDRRQCGDQVMLAQVSSMTAAISSAQSIYYHIVLF